MATYKKINQLEEAAKRLNTAGTELGNMTYDNFKAGNVYKGLQRDYQQGGQMAMKDTLGQVAARTGGMASSYATSAANQSYNNYMKGLEDAARSLFNEEYSRAKDKYNTARDEYSTAYGEYRDELEDQRYDETQKANNRQDYLDSIIEMAGAGITPDWDPTKAAEFGITEEDFNNAVSIGTNQHKNSAGYLSNQKATDDRLEQIFGAEGFDWNKYDWNGDGKVDETDSADAYDFSGSSYGADYWQQYWKDAQQGYADENTKAAQDEVIEILKAGGTPTAELLVKAGFLDEESAYSTDEDGNGIPDGLSGLAATMWQNNIDAENEAAALENEAKAEENKIAAVNDIKARIANGESLEDIASDYDITNDAGWKAVTGMSKAEWTKEFNDNTAKNYSYQDTEAGRAEIVGKLIDSGTLSLPAKDQSNFDYIFGTGAYAEVKRLIDNIGMVQLNGADTIDTQTNAYIDDEVEAIANRFPTFSSEQIYALLEKANPDVFRVWADEMVRD